MPVRRSRAEQLALIPPGGGAPIVLFDETREPGELTTQDIFQVSPDGAHLAYASHGVLHVRAIDGSERTLDEYSRWGRMRFSPDGAHLAAIVGEPSSERGQRVVLMELATGQTRELGAFTVARQLEWMRDAVVVQEWDHAHSHDVLTELPIAPGTARAPIVQLDPTNGSIDKFVAAGTGTRLVAFVGEANGYRVLSLDANVAGAPKDLGLFSDYVTNAAASLDGQRVAFTTPSAVFVATGDEHPHAVSERGSVRSLWFARDGRLGYASDKSATILAPPGHGASTRHFDSDSPISMLRFDPTSERALVVTPTAAWDVASAKPARLVTGDSGTLLGVDSFAGGLVVWSD